MPRKTTRSITLKRKLDFTRLVDTVRQVCERSVAVASRAVNVSLTLRNWLVGFYIVEYEQHGADRAQYGERLLEKLADALADKGTAEMSAGSLRLYRQFFLTYPGIWQSAIAKTKDSPLPGPIWRSLIAESDKSRLFRESPTPKSKAFQQPGADEHTLITRLSFTHLAELIAVNDPLKRVTWFRKHMMLEGDNPPVGLLLCTQKDRALAEYALAAMNNRLFVSKYQLVLPSKEDLRRFLEQQRRELVDE